MKTLLRYPALSGALLLLTAARLCGAVVGQVPPVPIAPNTSGFLGSYPEFTLQGVTHRPFWVASPYTFDIDGNGTTDLTFIGFQLSSGYNSMRVSLHGENKIWHQPGPGAIALLGGTLLGSSDSPEPDGPKWRNDADFQGEPIELSSSSILFARGGPFGNLAPEQRFLGLRFERDGEIHYGWLGLSSILAGKDVVIHQWAWESEPGKPIVVGQIPEPGAGTFALGALTAWWAWRRKRRQTHRGSSRSSLSLPGEASAKP